MKLLLSFIAVLQLCSAGAQEDSLLVVSWNVENYLNPRTDSTGRYTYPRFRSKCNGIAKTLLLIAGRCGRLPDAVALMEVGDRYVLERLVRDTPLRKLDYAIVHYDSPDRRGIDCALLYRRSTMSLLRSRAFPLRDSSGALMRTRDILLAQFEGLDILVNHHPSKVGADSERRRTVAMKRMLALMDSLEVAGSTSNNTLAFPDGGRPVLALESSDAGGPGETGGPSDRPKGDGEAVRGNSFPRAPGGSSAAVGVVADGDSRLRRPILAVGDFNDDVWPHDGPRKADECTIKYNGSWEKIDGYFCRGPLIVREQVFNDPSLTEPDRSFGGTKPHRSFSGPRWLGGVSDHYPVIFRIVVAQRDYL